VTTRGPRLTDMVAVHAVVEVTFGPPGSGGRHDVVIDVESKDDVRLAAWMPRAHTLGVAHSVSWDPPIFRARWWSPRGEIELCGSGALATGGCLLTRMAPDMPHVTLKGRFHDVVVRRDGDAFGVRLPPFRLESRPCKPELCLALGVPVSSACSVNDELRTYVVEPPAPFDLATIAPAIEALGRLQLPDLAAVVVTSQSSGGTTHFRYFTPWHGIDESPVAASAHAVLGPYWQARTGRSHFVSRQQSRLAPEFDVHVDDDCTWFTGKITIASMAKVNGTTKLATA